MLTYSHGWPGLARHPGGHRAGLLIGTLQGFIFAKVGVPAFVVTLAGNLGWLGLQL